ncbi:MAG TPA: mechanosensitive ion channel family protein, partial [Phycisphaeraceae bacterium]|nr:mechanosensitive ion channel family protein [Phycisphaeraceae bacterium]
MDHCAVVSLNRCCPESRSETRIMKSFLHLFAALLLFFAPVSAVQAQEIPLGGTGSAAKASDAAKKPDQEQQAQAIRPQFDSPQSTMRTFLESMNPPPGQKRDFDAAVECMDTSKIAREAGRDTALMLYGILNRIGYIDVDRYWNRPEAERRQKTEFIVFPRGDEQQQSEVYRLYPQGSVIISRDKNGEWKFSADTVAGVRDFYDHISSLTIRAGVDERQGSLALRLRSLIPPSLVNRSFLTIELWQWIGLALIIFAGVVIDFLIRWLVLVMGKRSASKRGADAEALTWKKVIRPVGLFAAAAFWISTLHLLLMPDLALRILLLAARLFLMLSAVWAAYGLTDLASEILARKAARTTTRFDDVLIPLLRKSLKILITIFGLIYIADSLQIEIAPLLTGLGIGGLGFAFAAKDTIENLFGSITVIADRPFEVGDWIVIGDVEGTVEELGFRSTRVRTFYNSLVTVPNATLVRATVDNFGKRKYRRVKTHIGIQYDTPPDRIEAFCEGIRELIRVHPYTRKDYYQVWLHRFGPSSLDILLYAFHEAPDWQTELRERHRLFLDIIRLADRLGVQFAFPTQTLHIYKEEKPPAPGDLASVFKELHREENELPPDRAQNAGRRIVRELTA